MIAALCFVLALLALVLWAYQRRQLRRGLVAVVYSDTDARQPGRVLTSHRYRLAGKPDYLVRSREGLMPVEVKSRACGSRGPYAGEEAQLLAYCLLAEDITGEPVHEGLLEFKDRQFRIPFGDRERRKILTILDEMREARHATDIARSHNQPARCRGCGVRASCREALT